MNLARRIAWRYLRRPTDQLVSAVGMASVLGLVIGVMALVISMALMTGYRRDLQTKLLGGNAEVFVYSVGAPIADPRQLVEIIRGMPGVADGSPTRDGEPVCRRILASPVSVQALPTPSGSMPESEKTVI